MASFLAHRRQHGHAHYFSPRALDPLIGYLRGIGVVVRVASAVETPIDRILREYAENTRPRALPERRDDPWLHGLRPGIRSSSIRHPESEMGSALPVGHIGLVVQESRRSIRYCKHKVTGLRSLLRFLHVRGHIPRDLAGCVPVVAGWRLAWLPRALKRQIRSLACCSGTEGVTDRGDDATRREPSTGRVAAQKHLPRDRTGPATAEVRGELRCPRREGAAGGSLVFPLPRTTISPARQSRSSNSSAATSPARKPRRTIRRTMTASRRRAGRLVMGHRRTGEPMIALSEGDPLLSWDAFVIFMICYHTMRVESGPVFRSN